MCVEKHAVINYCIPVFFIKEKKKKQKEKKIKTN